MSEIFRDELRLDRYYQMLGDSVPTWFCDEIKEEDRLIVEDGYARVSDIDYVPREDGYEPILFVLAFQDGETKLVPYIDMWMAYKQGAIEIA